LRLNYEIKRPYVERMQKLCSELGIGFFVSDAHHKEKCDHGNCCGLPKDKYFGNYQKCQFTQAIVFARAHGEVRFSDITKNEHQFLKNVMWRKAQGLNQGNNKARLKNWNRTLFDMMRFIWNSPKRSSSPWRYFAKMLIPTGLDKNGDVIYRFNKKKYGDKSR